MFSHFCLNNLGDRMTSGCSYPVCIFASIVLVKFLFIYLLIYLLTYKLYIHFNLLIIYQRSAAL